MTDNGSPYVSIAFRQACQQPGIRHLRTKPYTPCTNGKAERFIQTALREWAYASANQGSKAPNAGPAQLDPSLQLAPSPLGATIPTTPQRSAPSGKEPLS